MKVEVNTVPSTETSLVAKLIAFVSGNLLLVSVLALVGRCLYKRYASPLRNVPGPWLASVSRLWKGRVLPTIRDEAPDVMPQFGRHTMDTPS
jgi:hypothetical protein